MVQLVGDTGTLVVVRTKRAPIRRNLGTGAHMRQPAELEASLPPDRHEAPRAIEVASQRCLSIIGAPAAHPNPVSRCTPTREQVDQGVWEDTAEGGEANSLFQDLKAKYPKRADENKKSYRLRLLEQVKVKKKDQPPLRGR